MTKPLALDVAQLLVRSRENQGERTPRLTVRRPSMNSPRYSAASWFSNAIERRSRFSSTSPQRSSFED